MNINVEADNITLIHLSDIHISTQSDPILERTDQICRALNSLPNNFTKKVVILWSGDIAQQGSEGDYKLAEEFYINLYMDLDKHGYEHIGNISVPGNHDVEMGDDSRIDAADKINEKQITASRIKSCVAAQENYFRFTRDVLGIHLKDEEMLYYKTILSFEKFNVIFHCFNSSWLSRLKNKGGEEGKLAILTDTINVDMSSYNYSISVIHHPYEWLNPHWNRRTTREFIDKLSDLVITGHEHNSKLYNTSFENTEAAFLEAAVLQERGEPRKSGFTLLNLNINTSILEVYRCSWSNTHYDVSKIKSLDVKRRVISNGVDFTYKKDFADHILSMPPGLSGSLLPISLTDVIEIPDFISQDTDQKGLKKVIRSKNIMQHLFRSKKCLLFGESKSGKTTLLYEFMDYLRKKDIIPLYINLSDHIKNVNRKKFDDVIELALKDQYIDDSISAFNQLPKAEKALLVDNLDVLDSSNLKDLVEFLENRFDYIYLTARPEAEVFSLEELGDDKNKYERLEFSPLNRQQRRRIIDKLAYYFLEETDLAVKEQRLSIVEEDVNRLLRYNNLPSWPIYVILVSKSFLDSNYNIGNSASYGHLYEILINNNVARVYKNIDEFLKTKKFIGYLAFNMHESESFYISSEKAQEIADYYEEFYDAAINLKTMLGNLTEAGILQENGTRYSFAYPAFFYYFVAQHINSLEISQKHHEIDKIIANIKNIYNTEMLLFLAYLYTEDYIMNKLRELLVNTFKDLEPLDFQNDLNRLDKHIKSVSEIVYKESSVIENKDRARESLDISEENARQAWKKYEDKKDDFQDDYTLAFKIIEILGQIIRSKSGILDGNKKAEVIIASFDVILRAGTSIVSVVDYFLEDALPKQIGFLTNEENPDSLDKSEIISRVSQLMTLMTQAVVYSMIKIAANSLGYENLRKTFIRIEKTNTSQAYKFFLLGARLNSATVEYPFDSVVDLHKEVKKITFTRSILQWMVYHHILYNIMPTVQIQKALSDVGLQYEPNIRAKTLA